MVREFPGANISLTKRWPGETRLKAAQVCLCCKATGLSQVEFQARYGVQWNISPMYFQIYLIINAF
jgi:hypothetical protein